MRCELMPGIRSISGTMKRNADGSRLEFRTFQRPDGTTETRAYICPKTERTTPPSAKELAHRALFSAICTEVHRRIKAGDTRPRKLIWAEVKTELMKQ